MNQARHQYLELDGLRGVAALSVLLLHAGEIFGASAAPIFNRHAYLAVDFFLMLSGFVIAHAYEARLKQPGAWCGYLIDRAIRLHPMLVFGGALGGIALAWTGAASTGWAAML